MTRSATEQPDVDMDSRWPYGLPDPTGPATEQPDPAMGSVSTSPVDAIVDTDSRWLYGLPDPTGSATEQPDPAMNHGTLQWEIPVTQLKWEIHVSFNNDMWWAMPHELSDPILQQWQQGAQQVSFIWDWKNARKGSYQPDGAETSINRYIIDFDTMQQRNTDNNRIRKVQVVAVLR